MAFYANPMGLEVFVTKKGDIVYSLQKKDEEGIKISSFKETLIRTPLVSGRDRHEAVFNYFIGNDKSKWKGNVPSYSSVDLGEIAEGLICPHFLE